MTSRDWLDEQMDQADLWREAEELRRDEIEAQLPHQVTVAGMFGGFDLNCEMCCWERHGVQSLARAEQLADEHEETP